MTKAVLRELLKHSHPSLGSRGGSVEPHYISTGTQDQLLSDMMLSHYVGDICLVGPSVSSKHFDLEIVSNYIKLYF